MYETEKNDQKGSVIAIAILVIATLILIIVIGEAENIWFQRRKRRVIEN
jgi:hypothetical protein